MIFKYDFFYGSHNRAAAWCGILEIMLSYERRFTMNYLFYLIEC